MNYLLFGDLDVIPQALEHKLLASAAAVDILDVISGGLEVAGGVVALGDEDVVGGTVVDGLGDGNGGALKSVSFKFLKQVLLDIP